MKLKNSQKQPNTSIEKLAHFEWGGTTPQWEETAEQLMNCLQEQLDDQENEKEKQKKIEYGNQKQYW
ncbi:hypothetical protein [Crassaminicella indica]|uniref:Uncharacterized protein n=1 Tax=Crassaminicella indica TaxID=2855394 RepID=A0ABX8RA81_9CLOT|nr:hypothetical protein [Crassaminicella indica]QXM05716.1 hypothetical protein KVH43_10115 [Crassaminicella indica]